MDRIELASELWAADVPAEGEDCSARQERRRGPRDRHALRCDRKSKRRRWDCLRT